TTLALRLSRSERPAEQAHRPLRLTRPEWRQDGPLRWVGDARPVHRRRLAGAPAHTRQGGPLRFLSFGPTLVQNSHLPLSPLSPSLSLPPSLSLSLSLSLASPHTIE